MKRLAEPCSIGPKLSATLDVYKALAIFCVILAHCTWQNATVQSVSSLLGTLGVPVFLLVSGFLMNWREKAPSFWQKKVKTIVVPWLLWGSVTYAVAVVLGSTGFGPEYCLRWILGWNTWLYFVPVLLVSYLLVRICRGSIVLLWALVALSLITNGLTVGGLISPSKVLTNYQNPLNWVGFVAVGMLLRCQKLKKPPALYVFVGIIAVTVWLAVLYCRAYAPSYWSVPGLAFECLAAVSLFGLAWKISDCAPLRKLGQCTYPIYFLHMQFGLKAGETLFLVLGIDWLEWLVLLLKPTFIAAALWLVLRLIAALAEKLKLDNLLWILGIRARKG